MLAAVRCSVLLARSLRNKSSKDMAFPHPQSRKDHYRKKDKPEQPQMTLIAESESPAATSLAPVLRQVVQEIDRDMAVFDARSMEDIYINRAVKTPTVIAEIVSTLGVMGLTLPSSACMAWRPTRSAVAPAKSAFAWRWARIL